MLRNGGGGCGCKARCGPVVGARCHDSGVRGWDILHNVLVQSLALSEAADSVNLFSSAHTREHCLAADTWHLGHVLSGCSTEGRDSQQRLLVAVWLVSKCIVVMGFTIPLATSSADSNQVQIVFCCVNLLLRSLQPI